jgi:hypothetical protein
MRVTVSVATDAQSAAITVYVNGPTGTHTAQTGRPMHGTGLFTVIGSPGHGTFTITATVAASSGTVPTNPPALEV